MNFITTTFNSTAHHSAHKAKPRMAGMAPPQQAASTLSRRDLQRLVAQMID